MRNLLVALASTSLGGFAIIAFAYGWLAWSVPAHAAECIIASWYGPESGNRTASGDYFDGTSLTAAHRTLPFGTKLRVTYKGKSVVVTINDRGPFIRGRTLDLSKAAAKQIGLIRAGVDRVCIERL